MNRPARRRRLFGSSRVRCSQASRPHRGHREPRVANGHCRPAARPHASEPTVGRWKVDPTMTPVAASPAAESPVSAAPVPPPPPPPPTDDATATQPALAISSSSERRMRDLRKPLLVAVALLAATIVVGVFVEMRQRTEAEETRRALAEAKAAEPPPAPRPVPPAPPPARPHDQIHYRDSPGGPRTSQEPARQEIRPESGSRRNHAAVDGRFLGRLSVRRNPVGGRSRCESRDRTNRHRWLWLCNGEVCRSFDCCSIAKPT